MGSTTLQILVLGGGAAALLFVVYLSITILRENPGNDTMKEISRAIRMGSHAFLRREYLTLGLFTAVTFVVLLALVRPSPQTAISYLAGTLCSALAGWLSPAER